MSDIAIELDVIFARHEADREDNTFAEAAVRAVVGALRAGEPLRPTVARAIADGLELALERGTPPTEVLGVRRRRGRQIEQDIIRA